MRKKKRENENESEREREKESVKERVRGWKMITFIKKIPY